MEGKLLLIKTLEQINPRVLSTCKKQFLQKERQPARVQIIDGVETFLNPTQKPKLLDGMFTHVLSD